MSPKVTTRFAPSPTGEPHVGTALYALLNFLFARQNEGKVIMRSEDTDIARSKREFEDMIINDLKWLSIIPDEFYRQSERLDVYKNYIQKLLDTDKAYISKETQKEENKNSEVIRFKNPNKVVEFVDSARGKIAVDTTDLGDFIIARDINSPLYHLTVVVDDFDMGITHVIRGEDGLSNTPRQILIQEAIGAPRPIYAHFPFILGPDKSKLGKRHGAKSIGYYRELGYLPEALINFLILLAWHPTDDREIFSLSELINEFDLSRISKSGAIFDQEKLNWINREHLLKLNDQEFTGEIRKFLPNEISDTLLVKLIPILRERISFFNQAQEMYQDGDFDYFLGKPSPEADLIVGKSKASMDEVRSYMSKLVELLSPISKFTAENVKDAVWSFAQEVGKGKVLWPMRVLLSGKEKSPDPFIIAEILGKDETLERLRYES